ncbi:hypothetical protein HanIR_Chr02g0067421 [Helianthus annuus]|nr:hypothetical protein HanIR_Chr02g0067421 [Helianthus annuus]
MKSVLILFINVYYRPPGSMSSPFYQLVLISQLHNLFIHVFLCFSALLMLRCEFSSEHPSFVTRFVAGLEVV